MSMTSGLRELFIGWFDYYAGRASERFAGITDDEYLWEPAAGVPTIAWRWGHVCSTLTEHELRAVAFGGGKADHGAPSDVPSTASAAAASFERAVARWKHDLTSVTEERLWEPLGPEAGPFSEDPVVSFVEHIHDEFIHHTAEIALLRDLYRAGATSSS